MVVAPLRREAYVAVAPTEWQRSRHPAEFLHKIQVQHEGIDTEHLGPDPQASITTPSGIALKAGDPVVTYVARNLEPYRGFHIFMRALEKLQRLHPTCHAVIVGGDEVSYGRPPPRGAAQKEPVTNWREHMLSEVHLDMSRTHFMGRVPKAQFVKVLQVSAAHVYLTYPFVLSWSLLEAMACGAPIVASDTAPVREVIQDGVNGWLVDFFDLDGAVKAMLHGLKTPDEGKIHGAQARRDMRKFELSEGVSGYEKLLLA